MTRKDVENMLVDIALDSHNGLCSVDVLLDVYEQGAKYWFWPNKP
jgi:hypothetical protein